MWRINTSNPGKLEEFARLFQKYGESLEATDSDLPEIDADPLTVIVHKASQVPEGVVVEDTSLDVEGVSLGVNIRWLLDHLEECAGHAASWNVYLAYRKGKSVRVYQGQMGGVIVPSRGKGGFGFDPYFLPNGKKRTLAEDKPDEINARALAVEALLKDHLFAEEEMIINWEGEWQ